MASDRILLGVSACLLGEKVRYDGNHKLDRYVSDTLGRFFQWVAVCPEVECGLPVPREPMRLVDGAQGPRLVTLCTREDHSERMQKWMRRKMAELAGLELCGFVFKSKSPSSGMRDVKIYNEAGQSVKKGSGLFAGAFMQRFPLIPVEDEARLCDAGVRGNFIERVFVYARWCDLMRRKPHLRDLVDFHTKHKLLIMAHSPSRVKELGALVAAGKVQENQQLFDRYISRLMSILRLQSTVHKNTTVLQHAMGYLKKQLRPDEKKELLEIITRYHGGLIPLIVPIVLIDHYVRTVREPYLCQQYYLNPHPVELKLRNPSDERHIHV